MTSAYPSESIRRVLVTRLRWLGDVVMSTPMLETLREAFPEASIEYLTYTSFAPALRHHPACDRVHTLPPKPGPRATLAMARRLRRQRFDWCFDTLGNPRSAILVALSRPCHSAGPGRPPRSWLYEHRVPGPSGDRSAVRYQLDVLAPLLGRVDLRPTSLHVEDREREKAGQLAKLEPGKELLLVHPGASKPNKIWPVERWPGLVAELQAATPDPCVRVISQRGFEDVAQDIARSCDADVAALPLLDVRSVMALLAQAALYVGNDGGILHCAVALRVPTVGIFGPTDEYEWFPYADWGPYRAVRRQSEAAREIAGREVRGLPDASIEEVMRAVEQIRASRGPY